LYSSCDFLESHGEDGQRLALDTVIAVGHVHCCLFVTGHDDLDAVPVTAQSIHQAQVAVPRNADRVGDLLAYQHLNDDLRACELHVAFLSHNHQ
jgi:hypothetical protein